MIVGPDPLDHNPAAAYLAGLSEGSRRTMRGQWTDADLDQVGEERAQVLPFPGPKAA